MRNYFFAILFLLSVSTLGNSELAAKQDVYEKACRAANDNENAALFKQLLKTPRENSKSLLINHLSIYKQLADKFLEFSIKAPLSREEYSLLWEFSHIYPIKGEKTFTEALTYYLKNDWEKSEQILNHLMQNGEKRPGVLVLLGNMAIFHGQKDSWMFNQVIKDNPFGTIDFLDNLGVIVPLQKKKPDSRQWAINLFGIIEKHRELQQNEYLQMKLRNIAEAIFLWVEGSFSRENVSQAQLDIALQEIIFQIQKLKLFQAIDKVLSNVTYKLKYELRGSSLTTFLVTQRCESTSKELKKIIPEKDSFIVSTSNK